jgi:hypothetical protein
LTEATRRNAGRRGAGLTAGSDFVIFRGFAAARFVLVTLIAPRLALARRLILAMVPGVKHKSSLGTTHSQFIR